MADVRLTDLDVVEAGVVGLPHHGHRPFDASVVGSHDRLLEVKHLLNTRARHGTTHGGHVGGHVCCQALARNSVVYCTGLSMHSLVSTMSVWEQPRF